MIDTATPHPVPDRSRLAQLERAIVRSTPASRPVVDERARRSGRERPTPGAPGERRGFARHHGHDDSDTLLVGGAAAGHGEAFAALFRRHAGAVRRAIGDKVHDRERCEELVQDTFVRAFTNLGTLRDPTRFRPWVLQVARNLATDEVRRGNRRRHLEVVCDDVAGVAANRHDEPAAAFELRQLAAAVAAGMSTLSDRDHRVLEMSARAGLGIDEIAHGLGISPGAAKVVLHRARRRLAARVRDAHDVHDVAS